MSKITFIKEHRYSLFLTSVQIDFQNVVVLRVQVLYLDVCLCMTCVCVRRACTTHKSQQLELELLTIVVTMWVLGIKPLPSGAIGALSCCAPRSQSVLDALESSS